MMTKKTRHHAQSQKRVERVAKRLRNLARKDPERFKQEWNHRVNCWLGEIRYRARALRKNNLSKDSAGRVFAVMEYVDRLLVLLPQVEGFSKQKTREILQFECAKALATAFDPNLYRLVKNYRPAS